MACIIAQACMHHGMPPITSHHVTFYGMHNCQGMHHGMHHSIMHHSQACIRLNGSQPQIAGALLHHEKPASALNTTVGSPVRCQLQ
eukprot:107584-Pelagomonas_calceolata.AAC.1